MRELFEGAHYSRARTIRSIRVNVLNNSRVLSSGYKYPNDSNISRANYYFLRPQVRELFEILKCANLIEGANYY